MNNVTKISRYCSKLLRHNPEDLKMDKNGWVKVEDLLEKLKICKDELDFIVESNDKKRFTYSDDVLKIRANQGHSIDVDAEYEEAIPPLFLYHGTSQSAANIIFEEGLKSMKRTHVHLSADTETATNVGRRHCKKNEVPFIFIINTEKILRAGLKFYKSKNNVWLIKEIPLSLLK